MEHGFIKIAAVTPKIKVADPKYNAERICEKLGEAYQNGARIIVFPELCLTSYTCQDLFLQDILLKRTKRELQNIVDYTEGYEALVFVGLPLEKDGKLYNVAAVIYDGEILGFVPKTYIPNYGEFYEERHFVSGRGVMDTYLWNEKAIPFGTDLLFTASNMEGLSVGCEICEDLWAANPPSTAHAQAGATLIVNLSASNETIGKAQYREMLVKSTSARLVCGYVYASAGEGESTQDLVFGGHNLIAENGAILGESKRFTCDIVYGDLDVERIRYERRRMNTFEVISNLDYIYIPFELEEEETKLTRSFSKHPFVPEDERTREQRCDEILSIQSYGLKKRYEHTGCKTAVIGVSGGLDSTLALLVTARTFDMLELPRNQIFAITMPCFGTTDRTYDNACKLARTLGLTLEEIDIKEAVRIHFRDIKHEESLHNVTYENGQARERTQILMDIANRESGLVIGTGDMSELALGWATYNGDHMSMYGVNAGVPKTLVRHLVKYYADTCQNEELRAVLLDVLNTPVSPELLPPVDGEIAQKTEDLVGPYELHDFYLYYMLRLGFGPAKIFRIAKMTFEGLYDEETLLKWLKNFYRRFFAQQFKRSCLPDGPKVGSVAVSPRGDLRMPSDASRNAWMNEVEEL